MSLVVIGVGVRPIRAWPYHCLSGVGLFDRKRSGDVDTALALGHGVSYALQIVGDRKGEPHVKSGLPRVEVFHDAIGLSLFTSRSGPS